MLTFEDFLKNLTKCVFLFYLLGVDVIRTFESVSSSEPDLATAVGAIKTLMQVLEKCQAGTLQVGLIIVNTHCISHLKRHLLKKRTARFMIKADPLKPLRRFRSFRLF